VRRDGSILELPGIGGIAVEPGDQIVIETPGGGGYGAL
jgi:5-oxoprolinase (ATP-hydrolysing)